MLSISLFVIVTLCLVAVSDEPRRISVSFKACFNCLGEGVAADERGLFLGRLGDIGNAVANPVEKSTAENVKSSEHLPVDSPSASQSPRTSKILQVQHISHSDISRALDDLLDGDDESDFGAIENEQRKKASEKIGNQTAPGTGILPPRADVCQAEDQAQALAEGEKNALSE